MAFPQNRFIDFNKLLIEPANLDVLAVYGVAGNEQLGQEYGVFKSYYLKTNEDRDVNANIEFQANKKLKFGSLGEFEMYNDATDMFLDNTKATGKTIFKLGGADFVVFDPVNNSIATYGNHFNFDGTPGAGLFFGVGNAPTVATTLKLNAGIAANDQNISRTGASDTGLEFDVANLATFNQAVSVLESLDVTGQVNANKTGTSSLVVAGESVFEDHIRVLNAHNIDLGSGKINEDGSSTKGFGFSAGVINAFGKIKMAGTSKNIELGTGFISDNGANIGLSVNAGHQFTFTDKIFGLSSIDVGGFCDAATGFKFNGVSGLSATVNLQTDNTITVSGGIITAKT